MSNASARTTVVSPAGLADLPFWRLLFIGVGFFGIQYAWAVQYSQMSTFLEKLGSVAWLTAVIWCAGPITGTITQPIIGALSDKTWTWLGSRRPFLLAGAVVCSLCMVAMPNAAVIIPSNPLLAAAIILWIWDTSINVCQGPIRWLAFDVVNKKQQPFTFSLMSFILAIGASVCFLMGSFITDIHVLFYFGAAAMMVTMTWTIITTPETQLPHIKALYDGKTSAADRKSSISVAAIYKDIVDGMKNMHPEAKKLCWVNGLTWFGGQCMFVFLPLFIAHNVFGSFDPESPAYVASRQLTSASWLSYYVVCFVAALVVSRLLKNNGISMKAIHTVGLLCMAVALLAMFYVQTQLFVLVAMGVAGVGWATTMAIPFAWVARFSEGGKGGIHLSVFNTYIALASFVASLMVGALVSWTGNDASALLLAGGVVLLSAILLQNIQEHPEETPSMIDAVPA